jgi:hypothetical protein
MKNDGIIKESLDSSLLSQYAVPEALTGPDWILAYEAGRREWLGNTNDKFISEHKYFGPLNDAGVVFYDENRRLPPIFEFKEAMKEGNAKFNFDTDVAIEEHFKFDNMDEEYFDSAESEEEDSESEDDEDSGTDF